MPKSKDIKTTFYRYADADLKEVTQTVDLEAAYEKPRSAWRIVLYCAVALAAAAGLFLFIRRNKKPGMSEAGDFAMPEEITPLSVLGLLRRIRQSGQVKESATSDLDSTLRAVETHYYAPGGAVESPDLTATARKWLGHVTAS